MSSEISKDPILTELEPELASILDRDIVNRHSFFQLKHFVVGKEYTIQSRMWCCIRELQARQQSIVGLNRQIADLEDDLKLAMYDLSDLRSKIEIGEYGIETEALDKDRIKVLISKQKRKMDALADAIKEHQKKLKETEEEAAFLAVAFRKLESKEPLLPYDDLESQTDYWNQKLTQELNLRILLRQPLDLELVKTILALKDDVPIKKQTLHMLGNQEKRVLMMEQEQTKAVAQKDNNAD